MKPPLPRNEAQRLEALAQYDVTGAPLALGFERITRLAGEICETPIAVIAFVGETEVWLKAEVGDGNFNQAPRETSFCAHNLEGGEPLVVPDATKDRRFADNPFVTHEPRIRFYASAPLVTPRGETLGALCVVDRKPRALNDRQLRSLSTLSQLVMTELELRREMAEGDRGAAQLRLLDACVARITDMVLITEAEPISEPGPRIVYVNEAFVRRTGYAREEVVGRSPRLLQGPETDRAALARIRAALERREPVREEIINYSKSGEAYWVGVDLVPITDPDGRVTHFGSVQRDISKRRLAEAQLAYDAARLRSSEEDYRLLFASHPQPMWVTDVESLRFIRVNAAALQHYGYTEDEFLGLTTLAIRPPADAAELQQDPSRIRGQEDHTVQSRHQRKNGSLIDVEVTSRHITLGGRAARLAMVTDITQRVRAEREAERSRRALQALSRCNAALVRETDERSLLAAICRIAVEVGGMRLAWVGYALNDEAKTIAIQAHAGIDDSYLADVSISWSEDGRMGRTPAARTVRTGRPTVVPDLAQEESLGPWLAKAQARGYLGVIMLPVKDGAHVLGVLALYLPEVREPPPEELCLLQELADNLAFGVVSLRARAEQRRTSEALLATEARTRELADMLDKAQDAILVRDLNHRITFWNKSAERVYGWTASEAMGKSVLELLNQDEAGFNQAMQHLLSNGEWAGELTQVRKDGQKLAVEIRWTLVRDEAGQPKSVLAINTDITERRKIEQQFLRVQRMESIGTLAGGIAHDLNNLLAPITMGIDLLGRLEPNPKAVAILESMHRSARRGADLVKQVLSFARGVEGTRSSVRVEPILQEIESMVRNTFPRNISIELKVSPQLWPVMADPTQLNQIMLNLCVNARDAMPNGGRLELSAYSVEIDQQTAALNRALTPGRYVVMQVTDNGTGIPPAIIDRIFEPFFTTKEVGKGTGLGLSTVLSIARSHGGSVNVYSEPNKGSVFKVYLPAQPEAAAGAGSLNAADKFPRGNGELILVVDDEASIQDIVKQALEAFGYRVVTASDGAEAVVAYAQRPGEIALVLTDMMMPVMDGMALIAALQRIDPKVVIVAASGLNANGNLSRALNMGVNHFLAKPYAVEAMLQTFRKALTASAAPA